MKNIRIVICGLSICCIISTVRAQVSNPDTMIHKIFATLQAKDEKAFVSLYPNKQQFARMVNALIRNSYKSDTIQETTEENRKAEKLKVDSFINKIMDSINKPGVFAEIQKDFGNTFRKIIELGEMKGIKWNEAKLAGYTIDTTSFNHDDGDIPGMKNMKGVIDFISDDSAYHMSFNQVLFIPSEGGWFGGEFRNLARKSESLDLIDTITTTPDSTYTDSTAMIMSTPKTKTPARKTKTIS